ncbi:MAG TPA: DNA alkylation repair protein [Acidimicrobiia bacterium]|nr:DNA alkylation repair protein [Acidimicrobiia bacterium]
MSDRIVAQRTLARLREWARDPSPHVRRLVSEGTRPRLPWAPRLRGFIDDPTPVLDLLELLKDDPATLVRRSVANNLNDIGKDHPDLLADVGRRWMVGASPERKALIRHALRSAVKRGEAGALEVLGFGDASQATITEVAITPLSVNIGERVHISFRLTNRGSSHALYNVDLKIHFVNANGATSPKVFKVKAVELDQGGSTDMAKSISLAQHTTRTHNPGKHEVEAMVNGVTITLGEFDLIAGAK